MTKTELSFRIEGVSSHLTLLTALTNAAEFEIESGEARIQHLRAEAAKRLEAAPNGDDDFVAVCRLVFEILALQDRINQDRNRISNVTA